MNILEVIAQLMMEACLAVAFVIALVLFLARWVGGRKELDDFLLGIVLSLIFISIAALLRGFILVG